ncbi:elongation factor P--(R)-beta-lysine ligase [Persephonella sp.]
MKQFLTEIVLQKNKLIKSIREYFEMTGAVEVFTPYLSPYPNLDPHIEPVEAEIEKSDGTKIRAFLHTSPEYQMKKILAQTKMDIYQICHVFRNKEGSKLHTVEFMMLEWYRVGYSLKELIEDTAKLIINSALSINGKAVAYFKNKQFSLENWEVITVDEAFYRYTGVYPEDREKLYMFLKNAEINFPSLKEDDYETNFHLAYTHFVEPNLGKGKITFIYDYPPEFSALSVVQNSKGKRFEAYIEGIELVNGYQELTDSRQLRVRLFREKAEKEKNGREYPVDEEFIELSGLMPPCSGASLGIDRLLMVLLNKENIGETQGLNWI